MKIENTIFNTYPLIIHAQGKTHKTDEWLGIVNMYPDINLLSDDITIVTFFSGEEEMSLKKQLNKYNIPHINAVQDDNNEWNNTLKIKYLNMAISKINTPYILCLDGLDTLLSEDMSDLIDRFLSFNCDILYNASKNNFPQICKDVEVTNSEYKYLNAGAFIGRTESIKEFYKFILDTEMSKDYVNTTSEQLRVRNGRSNYPKKDTIKVDTECILFQTLSKTEFIIKNNILKIIKKHDDIVTTNTISDMYGWSTQNGGTTGGGGGEKVMVSTIDELNKYSKKIEKLIIYVDGILIGEARIGSNKTIIGLPGAKINGNIKINEAYNIIVKNIIIQGEKCGTWEECKFGKDAIEIRNSKNIWLDHLDISDGQDGNLDIVYGSDFITISWCKFWYSYEKKHSFASLIGSDNSIIEDIDHLNVTFHHNWWGEGIVERQPRVRYGKVHVVNNLFSSDKSKYIIGLGIESKVILENNIINTIGKLYRFYDKKHGLVVRNNIGNNVCDMSIGQAFTPPYYFPIDDVVDLEVKIKKNAGATLIYNNEN